MGHDIYNIPNIAIALGYAGDISVNLLLHKIVFMLSDKSDKIRRDNSYLDYWVVNSGKGGFPEISSYRTFYF